MSEIVRKRTVQLYTDGACSGNPGPGGFGVILRFGAAEKELSAEKYGKHHIAIAGVVGGLAIMGISLLLI